MKQLIREFFFLRKGERRALYIVLCVLTISAVVRILNAGRPLPAYAPDEVFARHMESIRQQIDSVMNRESERKKYTYRSVDYGRPGDYGGQGDYGRKGDYGGPGDSGRSFDSKRPRDYGTSSYGFSAYDDRPGSGPLTPITFDPNTVSYDTLRSMHLSEYVCRNILRYRESGGSFREPADLAKIYGLSQEDFGVLLPYIKIRSKEGPETGAAGYGSNTPAPLELNRVDSADLLVLPGIGPWFAGRIIRYRDLLGGYLEPAQLLEVYGMDTGRYNRIASFLTADTSLIDRIDLNTSTFQEVISHPYISREETYAIFRYREFMDTIPGPEKLLDDQIVDHERFIRMVPYLTVNKQTD